MRLRKLTRMRTASDGRRSLVETIMDRRPTDMPTDILRLVARLRALARA
jgi:hypothetical protein